MSIENDLHRPNYRKYRRKRKNKRKTLVIVSFVLILILLVVSIISCAKNNKDNSGKISSVYTNTEISSEVHSDLVSDLSSVTTSVSSRVSSLSSTKSSSNSPSSQVSSKNSSVVISSNQSTNVDWRLIIANKQNPLPESYIVNTAYVSGNYRVDARIKDAYNSMISAAKKDGITLVIISGFRTYQGQTTLFNNKVNQYINKGYSRERAKELAAEYVAPPGTSEHLTGLAVDLISSNWYSYNSDLNSNFENTKEFKWLYENCADYGFVLRYPKDKVSITGYSYEPWHYRYVGVEAAKEIMSQKICLEEYVSKN